MTTHQAVRVGVIGCGVIGNRLLNVFAALSEIEIAAVCDVSAERARETAEAYGAAKWYTDYQELLQQDDVELVYVAVPPALHHRIALDVLAAKKHIFCEKPLANSLEEAREMLMAAREAGVVHAMNFPTYYRQNFKTCRQLLADGYLGELRRVELITHFQHWPRPWQNIPWIGGREQGGFTREVIPHFLQVLQNLYGPITRVRSALEFPQEVQACETGLIADLKLVDGTSVVISGVANIAEKERLSLTFYGTQGTLAFVNWTELHGGKQGEVTAKFELPPVDSTHDNPHLLELVREIVRAIRGEADANLCDFQVGYDVQVVLDALRHPAHDGWQDVTGQYVAR